MHSTVYFLTWCKLTVLFFLLLKNFNGFSLPLKLKDWSALGIQEYVKCQDLFIFNAIRDEWLKEKSLKYYMFFLDKELG